MATPFDHAAQRYLDEWVPRFVPYHLDLVRELALAQGQRVLVARSGPGAEVLAVSRAVGPLGSVRATDPSAEMVRICSEQISRAGAANVVCELAPMSDVGAGQWHAIVCAFGIWTVKDVPALLQSWSRALVPNGKVGALVFGPPDPADPFEMLAQSLRDLEPSALARPQEANVSRDALAALCDLGGLSLVRHTILRHPVSFQSAESFVAAIRDGRTWGRVFEALGAERSARVTARFYDRVGGPTAPLVFEPVATLAIAALPGATVDLAVRPSVVAPPRSSRAVADIAGDASRGADSDPALALSTAGQSSTHKPR